MYLKLLSFILCLFFAISAQAQSGQTTIRGELDDVATTSASEGGQFMCRITGERALHINLRDDSGTELGVAGDPVDVEGTVSATQSGTWNINDITGTISLPTGAATAANQSTIIGHVDGIEALLTTIDSDTSSIAAGQLPDGHNVTVDNASGIAAVNIQDGGNSITVDGAVTATIQEPLSVDDNGTTLSVDDGAGSLTVDGTVAVSSITTSVTPGTGATNLGKAEDAGHTTGDTGVLMLGVRNTSNATLTNTTLDYSGIGVNAEGSVRIVGDRASAATDANNPVKIGGVYNTTQPTFTNGQRGNVQINSRGALLVGNGVSGFTSTATQSTASNLNAQVVGNIAHDSADSGNPVKVGSQATDYQPDSAGEQGRSEVGAADRVALAANLRGELITAVKSQYTLLTGVDATYNDTTTTNTSAEVEVWQYRFCTVGFELDKANSPTDIEFDIEVSADGTFFTKLMNGGLSRWIYDDTTVGSGIERSFGFPVAAQELRVTVTATGTTSTATFTVDETFLYCRT